MKACGRNRKEDTSDQGEGQRNNEYSPVSSVAKAHDNRADAFLHHVDERPRELISRHKLDAKLHCKAPFEADCEVHTDPDITDTMEPRTKWGICLGPTGNMQGTHWLACHPS